MQKTFFFFLFFQLNWYYIKQDADKEQMNFDLIWSEVTWSTNWVMWFKINCVMIRIEVSACSWNSRFVVLSNEKQKIDKREMGESSTLDLWDLLSTKSLWITKQHICLIPAHAPLLLSVVSPSLQCVTLNGIPGILRAPDSSSPSSRLNKTNITRLFTHHWQLREDKPST